MNIPQKLRTLLYILLAIALLVTISWLVTTPSHEPLVVLLTSIAAIIGLLLHDNAKDYHELERWLDESSQSNLTSTTAREFRRAPARRPHQNIDSAAKYSTAILLIALILFIISGVMWFSTNNNTGHIEKSQVATIPTSPPQGTPTPRSSPTIKTPSPTVSPTAQEEDSEPQAVKTPQALSSELNNYGKSSTLHEANTSSQVEDVFVSKMEERLNFEMKRKLAKYGNSVFTIGPNPPVIRKTFGKEHKCTGTVMDEIIGLKWHFEKKTLSEWEKADQVKWHGGVVFSCEKVRQIINVSGIGNIYGYGTYRDCSKYNGITPFLPCTKSYSEILILRELDLDDLFGAGEKFHYPAPYPQETYWRNSIKPTSQQIKESLSMPPSLIERYGSMFKNNY